MRALLIATLFPFILACTRADDITLSDGTVYKNATIVSHSITSATIETDSGGAIVPLEKLPKDIQQKLGYDPQAADAAIKQRQAASDAGLAAEAEDMRYQVAAKKYLCVQGRIVPREVARVVTLKVDAIGQSDANDNEGNALGRGFYCNGSVLAQDAVTWIKSGKFFLLAPSLPSGDEPVVEAIAMPPKGSQPPSAYVTHGNTTYAVQSTVTQTDDGAVVYIPVYSITEDQWRKAGSPQ